MNKDRSTEICSENQQGQRYWQDLLKFLLCPEVFSGLSWPTLDKPFWLDVGNISLSLSLSQSDVLYTVGVVQFSQGVTRAESNAGVYCNQLETTRADNQMIDVLTYRAEAFWHAQVSSNKCYSLAKRQTQLHVTSLLVY